MPRPSISLAIPKMRLLDARAAAEYLGIPLRTFYYFAQEGRIARYRMGPRVTRYEQTDLDVFLQSCRCETFDKMRVKNVRRYPIVSLSTKEDELLDAFRRAGVKIEPEKLRKRKSR